MEEKLKVNSNIPHIIYAENVEDEALRQFEECLRMTGCVQGALMPDAHAGYTAPIGSVLKFDGKISPALVGYDIGCGMAAVKLDIKVDDISKDMLVAIKDDIVKKIPIGPNKLLKSAKIPSTIKKMKMTDVASEILELTGSFQLGTLGGGNHFIELGKDNDGFLNIVIHSGSRGVGYKIAEHYMIEACIASIDEQRYIDEFDKHNKDWYNSFNDKKPQYKAEQLKKYEDAKKEFVYRRTRARVNTNIEGHYSFDINSERGENYMNDMNMALEFAIANRNSMIESIINSVKLITGKTITTSRYINRNHNHAVLYADNSVVHRKGATHAELGMMGVIPGNMKDGSFIVIGKGNKDSMFSSSHGAGRVLSRRKAKDQLSIEEFNETMKDVVTNHTDSTIDEAPKAYKDIYEVMKLQEDLVTVIDQVIPVLNIKG